MRYSDIIDYPRPWNRQKYPVVAHASIAAGQLRDFERLIEDQTQTAVLGHDVTDEDQVLVYVACTTDDVKQTSSSHTILPSVNVHSG
jgi:hypothetical protein